MSAIDVQNSRQIRDPMDVLITLSLGTDIAMTYSGYSSAKVADGVLNQSSWPMRGLADLQGNGFPLDGSRVLYDPNTSPSQTNGKLGVRGNVGQPVSVTATGNDTIAALAISVTGAASVTLSGRTTEITGSHVTLQLLNTTATLTFQPSSEDRRIEIITVLPEADFIINNDNLIKATVSLRSDLSIIDPTLPESELNVEVYQDLDVSEAVASIPEDTPITYQAGYPGDMSPVRKFYISGQVTWKDNVLKIQAVDAVHFLGVEVPKMAVPRIIYNTVARMFNFIASSMRNIGFSIRGYGCANAFYDFMENVDFSYWRTKTGLTADGLTLRDWVAFCNNMFRFRGLDADYFRITTYGRNVLFDYVDAGRPTLRLEPGVTQLPTETWRIEEQDCANVIKGIDVRTSTLQMETKTVWASNQGAYSGAPVVGTARWVKGLGISLEIDTPCLDFAIPTKAFDTDTVYYLAPVTSFSASSLFGSMVFPNEASIFSERGYTEFIIEGSTPNGNLKAKMNLNGVDYEGDVYTSFIPWGASYTKFQNVDFKYKTMQANWNALVNNGTIGRDATEWSCDIFGLGIVTEDRLVSITKGGSGDVAKIEPKMLGSIHAAKEDKTLVGALELYPTESMKNLLNRSPVTCSFTWKGDPRIQPRDVFTFHRLDGTDEEWTFENITITHEGGGTLAEITARKGIV